MVLGLISILGKLMRPRLDSGSNIIFTPWSRNNCVHYIWGILRGQRGGWVGLVIYWVVGGVGGIMCD